MADLNKEPWSEAEDRLLIRAMKRYGCYSWYRVGSLLKRSAQDCCARSRYILSNVTPEKESEVLRLYKLFPAQYELIARQVGISTEHCYDILMSKATDRGLPKQTREFSVESQIQLEIAEARLSGVFKRKKLKRKK